MHELANKKAAVIGLGYVGMPLALALAKYGLVIGFDNNTKRIQDLSKAYDSNNEIDSDVLLESSCKFTDNPTDIKDCNIFIITVPTPIDDDNQPDLTAVKAASQTIGQYLKQGDIVVYESTVYPGVTEDICGPILEKASDLECGRDFFLGYSPERINPGDREHTLSKITKIVAGQNQEITDFLANFYGQINGDNIFKAKNIKTAEAAKAIENAQRDINVAFINEITMILNKLGLAATDVLEAAETKWNFLPFKPGLVGGHCIGVDPYYLAKCARDIGHEPEIILAGRKINDSMGAYLAETLHADLQKADIKTAKILILGFTFKENINDIRNTKVIDVKKALKNLGHDVDVHDVCALPDDVEREYGFSLLSKFPDDKKYDALIVCVSHGTYKNLTPAKIENLLSDGKDSVSFIYDIKGVWRHMRFRKNISYAYL